ncbi:MAG: NusA N-terminal domain-containing protein, partial [Acutalibacter sp.]
MAKKKEPEKQGNEELFLALNLLEKEKGIPVEFMLDKIKKAISTACKNNYGNEDVDIDVDPEKGVFNVYLRKEIVEEVEDPNRQYLLDKA